MQKFTRHCEYCQAAFETEFATKLYCSRTHKERAHQLRKRNRRTKVKTIVIQSCKGCGLAFEVRHHRQVFCSSDCQRWVTAQIKQERDRQYKNQLTPSFKRRVYFKNDGICGICNQPIDLRIKYPDLMSYSIDHIVPRSQGGSHSFTNLQPAHLGCNAKRGDKPL